MISSLSVFESCNSSFCCWWLWNSLKAVFPFYKWMILSSQGIIAVDLIGLIFTFTATTQLFLCLRKWLLDTIYCFLYKQYEPHPLYTNSLLHLNHWTSRYHMLHCSQCYPLKVVVQVDQSLRFVCHEVVKCLHTMYIQYLLIISGYINLINLIG